MHAVINVVCVGAGLMLGGCGSASKTLTTQTTTTTMSTVIDNSSHHTRQTRSWIPRIQIAPNVRMPVITIGTGGQQKADAFEIVTNWLELGGRSVDTAFFYQNQVDVARAVRSQRPFRAARSVRSPRLNRADLFVTTKIPDCESPTGDKVQKDLMELGLGYIDLLLIHYPNGDCSKAWKVLEDYYRNGTVRAIGISNFDESHIELLMKTAEIRPHVHQLKLNVFDYDPAQIEASLKYNMIVEAFSPLGQNSSMITQNPILQSIAGTHNVSTYQVALRWILQQGHHFVFQSKSKDHQSHDANVFDFQLSADDMNKLAGLRPNEVVV